ncbi:NUDIX hydrolase, partial [Klebsiella oxytoca]
SCNAVFGYASGTVSRRDQEDTESIQVLIAGKEEVRRILREEKVSIRAAYLLMSFVHMADNDPFGFLK